MQGSQQARGWQARRRDLHRTRQQVGQSVPDWRRRRPCDRHRETRVAGCATSITCCARSTSFAGKICCASARLRRATAICCYASRTRPAKSASPGGARRRDRRIPVRRSTAGALRLRGERRAGSAVTGWRSRERLAAPVAETRDVTFSRSRSHRPLPDEPLFRNHRQDHRRVGSRPCAVGPTLGDVGGQGCQSPCRRTRRPSAAYSGVNVLILWQVILDDKRTTRCSIWPRRAGRLQIIRVASPPSAPITIKMIGGWSRLILEEYGALGPYTAKLLG